MARDEGVHQPHVLRKARRTTWPSLRASFRGIQCTTNTQLLLIICHLPSCFREIPPLHLRFDPTKRPGIRVLADSSWTWCSVGISQLKTSSSWPPQDRTEWDYRKVALSFDLHPTTININSNHSPFVMPTFHRHSTSGWWRTHFSGLTSTTLSWRWNSKQRGCHFTSHGWGMFAKYQLLFSAGWLFFQWHVPVCTLFKGRVVYAKPENTIPETSETSGIEVEHEVYMLQGIILSSCRWSLPSKVKKIILHKFSWNSFVSNLNVYIQCDVVRMSHTSRIQDQQWRWLWAATSCLRCPNRLERFLFLFLFLWWLKFQDGRRTRAQSLNGMTEG